MDAGYVDGGRFYALSDKAQVEFDIPDDYRRYNQSATVALALLDDIVGEVDGNEDDFDAFYDSDWNYTDYDGDGVGVKGMTAQEIADAALIAATIAGAPEGSDAAFIKGLVDALEFPDADADDIAAAVVELERGRKAALTIFLNNLYN